MLIMKVMSLTNVDTANGEVMSLMNVDYGGDVTHEC